MHNVASLVQETIYSEEDEYVRDTDVTTCP